MTRPVVYADRYLIEQEDSGELAFTIQIATAWPLLLQPRDRVLLCSDGLWGSVSDATITEQLAARPISDATPELVEQALRNEKVPYQLSGGQSFFDRTEIKDVIAYFKAMAAETGVPYQTLINLYLHQCAQSGKRLY